MPTAALPSAPDLLPGLAVELYASLYASPYGSVQVYAAPDQPTRARYAADSLLAVP